MVDAGAVDSGVPDAGPDDAGMDAGPVDAGPADAGPVDAGPVDAGPPPEYPLASLGGADCDPLVPSQCGYPFPSNVYLVADAKTPTGRHVQFGAKTLPQVNGGAPIDPFAWSDSDGFSPGQSLLTQLPRATLTGLPTQGSIADSLKADSPTVLLDAFSGERVAHWVELDATSSDPADQALIIHPAARLNDATRYIVALRNVVDGSGQPLAPTPVFKALRDGSDSSDPSVAARRALYTDIFAQLKKAGVDSANLQLAWDFTTASRENNTRLLSHMVADALNTVGDKGPAYMTTIVRTAPDEYTARLVEGTMHVPLYLDNGSVVADSDPMSADLDQGFHLQLGPDGLPTQNGFADVPFIVDVPISVAFNETAPGPILLYGHDMFSDRHEGLDPKDPSNSELIYFISAKQYVSVSVDLLGFTHQSDGSESDDVKLQQVLRGDIGVFRRLVDRAMQGVVNQVLAVRMLKGGLSQDPSATYMGLQLIDNTVAFYRGRGQGGNYGVGVMALSPDLSRGYLEAGGAPYNLLLPRSLGGSELVPALLQTYGSARNVQLVLGLMQMHWDRLEADGFIPALQSQPAKTVLLDAAIDDFQTPSLSAQWLARSLGAKNLEPVNRELFGLEDVMPPYKGTAFTEVDFHVAQMMGVTIPATDTPPQGPESADPHGMIGMDMPLATQVDFFLRYATAKNTCSGMCDPD